MDLGLNMVIWELTKRCNLACPHCYSSAFGLEPCGPELSTVACMRLMDEMATMGVQRIGWTGGEPLLRKDFETLVAHGVRVGLRSGLTSNGLLMDEPRIRSLKAAGLEMTQISLDGSTPARNAHMRACQEEDFHTVVRAIQTCEAHGIPVRMAMVLGAENLDDGPAYLELAQRLGVSKVRFCGFIPAGRGRQVEHRKRLGFKGPDLHRLRDFVEEALSIPDLEVVFDPAFGCLPPDYTFHECQAGSYHIYLTSAGDVYPCTGPLEPEFVVGNVHARSLTDIYLDEAMRQFSRRCHSHLSGPCGSCENRPECHGGCRAVTYAHTGNLQGAFPGCMWMLQEV